MASKPDKKSKKVMKFGHGPKSHQRPKRPAAQIRPVAKTEKVSTDDLHHDEKTCVLCCEDIQIFAKGSCDHVVCFKCSSRMRVLCEEKYCAVCRMDLDKVAFIESVLPFKELDLRNMKCISDYGIFFQNDHVKNLYEDLLLNACKICTNPTSFGNFTDLRRHIRQAHDKQYCDLCLKNLKIFPREFRFYTRSELVTHRKSGDADDKSYKGHPQCIFCSERYYDNDELLSHLRKNHFWCHFCEKDGKQDYFDDYENLREHFKEEHFLCEENECAHERFTSAFRSHIDYQAHVIARHSKKMTKIAAKQARNLNIDIDYGTRKTQRMLAERGEQRSSRQNRGNDSPDLSSNEDQNTAKKNESIASDVKRATESQSSNQPAFQNEFPTLNGESKSAPTAKSSCAEVLPESSQGATATAAEVIKGKKKLEMKDVPRSREMWSKFSRSMNLDSEDAFPSLVAGNDANPVLNHPVSYKNTTSVRKKEDKAASKMKNISNGVSMKVVKTENTATKPKNTSPPGLRKDDAKSGSEVVNSMPPGVTKQTKTQAETSKKAPPGITMTNEQKKPSILAGRQKNLQNDVDSLQNQVKSVQERNYDLVQLMRSLLSIESFDKFKDLSGSFRRSEISASEYYNCIADLLGSNLDLVFFELVDLLPERLKQEELLRIYKSHFDSGQKTIESRDSLKETTPSNDEGKLGSRKVVIEESKKKHDTSSAKRMNNIDVVLCEICGISLSKKESRTHMDIHANNDFPELPASVNKTKNQSWKKQQIPIRSAWGQPK